MSAGRALSRFTTKTEPESLFWRSLVVVFECVSRPPGWLIRLRKWLKRSDVAKKKAEKEGSDYKAGNWVVYPTHGVGKVMGIEDQEIAGTKLRLIVISFEKDRMTLRVPAEKAKDPD